MAATVGELNIGDFIPILDWFDFQGINWNMKKIHKEFNKFTKKIIDDHVNFSHLLSLTSLNSSKEVEAEHDVFIHMTDTDTNIT